MLVVFSLAQFAFGSGDGVDRSIKRRKSIADEVGYEKQAMRESHFDAKEWFDALEKTEVVDDFKGDFIATHHGKFHADEVLAVAMLKMLPDYQKLPVVRTRDLDVIARAKIVVDVGGKYEADNLRFDHHQATFKEKYPGRSVTLSACGLVYKHFGKKIVRLVTGEDRSKIVIDQIYDSFFKEIDGIDNGQQSKGNPSIQTGITDRIGQGNPSWRLEATSAIENDHFKKAMRRYSPEVLERIQNTVQEWLPAREIVQQANFHSDQQVIELTQYCPWKSHFFANQNIKKANFVIYPTSRGDWRVAAIPRGAGFLMRLPEPWGGLDAKETADKIGITDCHFVHKNGFIGSCNSRTSAIKMAVKAREFKIMESKKKKEPDTK